MIEKRRTKLVLKIVLSAWVNESRDKRELSAVKEMGADVLVLAKGEKSGITELVDGFDVYRMSTRPLGNKVPKSISRFISIFTWAYRARKLSPQVISGHDLPALLIGYLSVIFTPKGKRPKLVYDAHEFEIGRNTKRSRSALWMVLLLERFLIHRCAFSIMVNDSIADEMKRIHKLKYRPVVVRSMPENWKLDDKVCKEVRQELFQYFGGEAGKILLIYHGMVCSGRGIEALIRTTAHGEYIRLFVLGDAIEPAYLDHLRNMAGDLGAEKKVLFHPAVPGNDLWRYIGAADLSMVMISPVTKSYYYALPNKFFESIQALTPMIASDLPEMKYLMEKYKIGLTCRPENVQEIYRCVMRMYNDQALYRECRQNMKAAKAELCWENEKKILKRAYREVLSHDRNDFTKKQSH